MDYYKCEECKKTFDEFEMNYKASQVDKKTLCGDCREEKKGLNKKRGEVELSFIGRIKIKKERKEENDIVLKSLAGCPALEWLNPEDFKYLQITEE